MTINDPVPPSHKYMRSYTNYKTSITILDELYDINNDLSRPSEIPTGNVLGPEVYRIYRIFNPPSPHQKIYFNCFVDFKLYRTSRRVECTDREVEISILRSAGEKNYILHDIILYYLILFDINLI